MYKSVLEQHSIEKRVLDQIIYDNNKKRDASSLSCLLDISTIITNHITSYAEKENIEYYPTSDKRPIHAFYFVNFGYLDIRVNIDTSELEIFIGENKCETIYYYDVLKNALYIDNEIIDIGNMPLQEFLLKKLFDIKNN